MARIGQQTRVKSGRGNVKGVPATPTLTATASGQTQVNLSWGPPSGVVYQSFTSYQLDRSTDQSSWTNLVSGTATSYADTGRTAGTTYYYRLRTFDGVTYGAYATANATTQATGSAVMSTRFAGVSLSSATGGYRVVGADSVTGFAFSDTSPRLWGGTEWAPPRVQVSDNIAGWSHQLLSGVNGPGGTDNESVLRITRNYAFSNPPNPQSPYQIFPKCTVAEMGMVYVRLKARLTASPTSGFWTIAEFKTGTGGSTSDRALKVAAIYDGGLGWLLRVEAALANSSSSSPAVWLGRQSTPQADSVLFNGNFHYFKGVFEDYPSAGAAPNHDWRRWFTLEFAFRLHSTTGPVAGNAAQGWTWVATALGSTTAAAANGTGAQRFYIPGSNVYDHPLINATGSGILFPWNHYGSALTSGMGVDIGSVEVYETWPNDASPHPVEAV